jgi:8-oxo-dGTP pyrophosphatase MutT (NUDIX family)
MTTSRCDLRVIHIAAAVAVDAEGRVLLVRKRGTEAFMQPGGKIGDGETAACALRRELREELGFELARVPRYLGRFSAAAANEPDAIVEADLFAVELDGPVAAAAEIAEMRWHDPGRQPDFPLAPLTDDHVLPLVRLWRQR